MELCRVDAKDEDFRNLVAQLDADLAVRDGEDHAFYHQYNSIDAIKHAIVGYQDGLPVACGAIKQYDLLSMEVKRMYVLPTSRGKGYASQLLMKLEEWARELGYTRCILETGHKQPEAIRLYTKQGYEQMDNYGQYVGVDNSVCFAKVLT